MTELTDATDKVIANPFDPAAWVAYARCCRAESRVGWALLAEQFAAADDAERARTLFAARASWPVAAPIARRLMVLVRPFVAEGVAEVERELRATLPAMLDAAAGRSAAGREAKVGVA